MPVVGGADSARSQASATSLRGRLEPQLFARNFRDRSSARGNLSENREFLEFLTLWREVRISFRVEEF